MSSSWSSLAAAPSLTVAGVLSGTSGDGIDVALTRCTRAAEARPETLAWATVPFEPDVAPRVRRVLDGGQLSVPELGRLHLDLGAAFGRAVAQVAREHDVSVDLVGSHGQTVWHFDGVGDPGTWQLGDGNQVARFAQAPCVCDFRAAHVAAGGHGAPLAILGDRRIFAHVALPAAVLNLGGMGNLSVWGQDPAHDRAWDTGPAGAWLDGLARRLLDAPCDRDGACALAGEPQEAWIAWLLQHPFFAEDWPRSTGRDTFGEAHLDQFLRFAGPGARASDLLASAVVAIARSVADSLERFGPPGIAELWVAGGGVHNRALLGALAEALGLPVRSSAAAGVDPDAREALLFACLAADFLWERWSPIAGTSAHALLGQWCAPPRGLARGESGETR